MGEARPVNERATPTSVSLRPPAGARYGPLFGLLPAAYVLATNAVGEVFWVLGLALVPLLILRCLELMTRYVALSHDLLTERKFFRVRTYPLSALALHEKDNGIDLRNDRGRLLLRLPRSHDKLEKMYEPSLSWGVTRDSVMSFLEDVFPDVAERRRRIVDDLRSARHGQGLSQSQVATRIGTTPSIVAQVESAETDVSAATLRRYASAVGRSLDWQLRDD